MADVNIYIEGRSDKEFLEAIFEKHFSGQRRPNFIDLEGNYSRLPQKSNRLKEGKPNLIVLDSDVNNEQLVTSILKPLADEEKAAGRVLLYQCFFIERNLEDLVRKICPAEEEGLWTCIDQYATCNSSLRRADLRPVDNKSKVYIYVNAHHVPNDLKLKTFQNQDIWDLDHNALTPLLDFLKANIL
ncbi:DUF3226 domain-containing protein [Marinoscillum sp.]|uniref:DUF3226 domain-containing protein n=1 Tax=Marinoscillum sp. TaxID=2024838 RepID=UPI003BACAB6F